MHHTVADKLRIMQRRNHGEHPFLLPEFQVGLEANQIKHALGGIVLPQLHHRIRLPPGFGVRQTHRLHGAVAQRIQSPARHHLHGHTAFKHIAVLKAVYLCLLGKNQFAYKRLVLLFVQGAVDVIRGASVIAGLPPGKIHIHRFRRHQRGSSIKEMQVIRAKILPDGF